MKLDTTNKPERRQSPRYPIRQSIDLVIDNGDIFNVESRNISSSGLQISCDSWVTDKIEPRGIQSHAVSHIRFKIIFSLSINETTKKLYAICRVMSVQRLSQDEYILSLVFVDFENGTESVLNEFLDQFKQKKTILDAIIET